MVNVIFVHGISIRAADYDIYFKRIKAALEKRLPAAVLSPCLWGVEYGARLRADGASIPQYAQTKSNECQWPVKMEWTERWELLTENPTLELQMMTLNSPSTHEQFDPTGKKSSAQTLDARIRTFSPSNALLNHLDKYGITADELNDARNTVVKERVYDDARRSMASDLSEYRAAWARAVIATTIRRHQECIIDAEELSALANVLADEIGPQDKGIMSGWLNRAFSALGTALIGRRRGHYSDTIVPYIGDVLVYQGHGENIRNAIASSIEKAGDVPVVLLGHSLGGIACVDLLAEKHYPTVKSLITVGSQAPLFYEMDALQKLRFGEPLPESFPSWLNIYDLRDFLSYVAEPIFKNLKILSIADERVTDFQVNNRQQFPQSHGGYFSNPAFWDAVIPTIAKEISEEV